MTTISLRKNFYSLRAFIALSAEISVLNGHCTYILTLPTWHIKKCSFWPFKEDRKRHPGCLHTTQSTKRFERTIEQVWHKLDWLRTKLLNTWANEYYSSLKRLPLAISNKIEINNKKISSKKLLMLNFSSSFSLLYHRYGDIWYGPPSVCAKCPKLQHKTLPGTTALITLKINSWIKNTWIHSDRKTLQQKRQFRRFHSRIMPSFSSDHDTRMPKTEFASCKPGKTPNAKWPEILIK